MILESIVTTVDLCGNVNIAPMGPSVSERFATGDPFDEPIVLRPFDSSCTYANLLATKRAVVHVTDDIDLFARAAVDSLGDSETIAKLVHFSADGRFCVLNDCHRWFAIEVVTVSDDSPRVTMQCRVVDGAIVRPFFGFNRAKHAVIEAAILATRTHLFEQSQIESELASLRPLVEKTGGTVEHAAFQFLLETIAKRVKEK